MELWEVGGPIFGGGRSNRLLIRVAGTHCTGLGFDIACKSVNFCEGSKSVKNSKKPKTPEEYF